MTWWEWIVLAIVVLVVVAALVWLGVRGRRTRALREQFGPEYERMRAAEGRRDAEAELQERRERRAHLDIRPLPPAARQRYTERWSEVQARFVDDPGRALGEADELVTAVMTERGYPMDDFEQRVADVSVDHPSVVEHYRRAHHEAERSAAGDATTEDLRRGMIHYRSLFEELLASDEDEPSRTGTD